MNFEINQFWKEWNSSERSIFKLLLFLFLFLLLVAAFYITGGIHQSIEALPLSKTESLEIEYRQLEDPALEIPVRANQFIVTQSAMGSKYQVPSQLVPFLLGLQLLLIAMILATITFMHRFWFLVAVAAVVLLFMGLQFDQLLIFGWDNRYFTFTAIGLLVVLLYFLHAFEQSQQLLRRFVFLLFYLVLIFSLSLFFAEAGKPALFLLNNLQIVAWVSAALLAISIGPDVIYWLFYLLTKSKSTDEGANNILHLMIMGTIYVAYIALTYAYRNKYIDLEMVYFNEFLLFAIVMILGIWSIQKRHTLFKGQLADPAIVGVLYLAVAALVSSSVIWIFATGNDPVMETFEDMITITQIGFGGMFLIYVIFNFHKPIREGLQAYKIVFKPATLPYFTYRFAGIIVVIALLARSNMFPVMQAISAYYNGLADYYVEVAKPELANLFYNMSKGYANNNHKANYSIGYDYLTRKDNHLEAAYYFKSATEKHASPYTYLNLSYARSKGNQLFDALFDNQSGLEKFPNDGYLLNNLGYNYQMVGQRDSAFYFYQEAYDKNAKDLAATNLLAFFSRYDYRIDPDSLLNLDWPNNIETKANQLALSNKYRIVMENLAEIRPDTNMSYTDYAYWNNRGIYAAMLADSSFLETFRAYYNARPISAYKQAMKQNMAHQEQSSFNMVKAFSWLRNLIDTDTYFAGKYYYWQALWAYEARAYRLAISSADKALKLNYTPANTIKIFSHIRLGELSQAKKTFDQDSDKKSIDSAVLEKDPLYRFLNKQEIGSPTFAYFKSAASGFEEIDAKIEGTSFEVFANYEKMLLSMQQLDTSGFEHAYLQIKRLPNVKELHERADMLQILWLDKEGIAIPDIKNNYEWPWKMAADAIRNDNQEDLNRIVKRNPFFSPLVIYLARQQEQDENLNDAYLTLIEALGENKHDILIQKHYSLVSLKSGLSSYAQKVYDELELLLTGKEWDVFDKAFLIEKQELEKRRSEWNM